MSSRYLGGISRPCLCSVADVRECAHLAPPRKGAGTSQHVPAPAQLTCLFLLPTPPLIYTPPACDQRSRTHLPAAHSCACPPK
eukprot:3203077-Pleurochrysis_carterae.AAC.1